MATSVDDLGTLAWGSDLRDSFETIEAHGFSFSALLAIFGTANQNGALRTPYGETNYGDYSSPRLDRTAWEAASWNPSPEWYGPGETLPPADPNADPKPSYDWLLAAAQLIDLSSTLFQSAPHMVTQFANAGKQTLAAAHLAHRLGQIHVGRGVEHMPGLIDIVHDANSSGRLFPPVILREQTGDALTLWTQHDLRELMSDVTGQANRLESAHNTLVPKILAWRAIAEDKTKTIAERRKAAKDAADFVQNYRAHLEKAVKDYNPDALPDDLPTLKTVLIERLGAAANRARNRVVDVESSQEAYLEAACNEQERALTVISGIRQGYNNRIREAADAATAKKEYADALARLFVVPTDNSPIWIDTGGDVIVPGADGYFETPVPATTGSRRPTVTVKVRNPDESELKHGRLAAQLLGAPTVFFPAGVIGWASLVSAADSDGVRSVTLTWGSSSPLIAGATVEVLSRNSCGATPLRIRFTAPPASGD